MKNILITGSAGSLGSQLIKFYSRKKFNVIAVDQININPKNKIIVKLPQLSYCALTYPVPVKIDITLKKIDLKFI